MESASAYHIPDEETLDRKGLEALQRQKLSAMLSEILPANRFYQTKLGGLRFDALRDPLEALPFTTRAELEGDQAENPPYGSNLTYPIQRYVRLHQTSGSSHGRPMRWLDTPESWAWWKRCWMTIYRAAGVGPGDRLVFPFSFGPFIGFWSAFDAAQEMGLMPLAAGGMSTTARLRFLIDNQATVLCCTPTYALRMAETAGDEAIEIRGAKVRKIIVAGEPGGSIPETRRCIGCAWDARVFDHSGMTEIGALGFECKEAPGGLHLMESQCIAEVIDPATGKAVNDGEPGELVITNLGRWGSPVIRYRTGDQVRVMRGRCACGRSFARMQGGILGRIDDMLVVRGTNVFPSSIEGIVRRFDGIAEFRIQIDQSRFMRELVIEVEPARGVEAGALCERLELAVHDAISLRPTVRAVAAGTLPRFEMKSRRLVRTKPGEHCPAMGSPTVLR